MPFSPWAQWMRLAIDRSIRVESSCHESYSFVRARALAMGHCHWLRCPATAESCSSERSEANTLLITPTRRPRRQHRIRYNSNEHGNFDFVFLLFYFFVSSSLPNSPGMQNHDAHTQYTTTTNREIMSDEFSTAARYTRRRPPTCFVLFCA